MNKNLDIIASKLDVGKTDMKKIKNSGLLSCIKSYTAKLLIAILTFIAGFFLGKSTCPQFETYPQYSGYPFGGVLFYESIKDKKYRKYSILAFITILVIYLKSSAIFGQAVEYGVYEKVKK